MTEEVILEIMYKMLRYFVVLNTAAQDNTLINGFLHLHCNLHLAEWFLCTPIPQYPRILRMPKCLVKLFL